MIEGYVRPALQVGFFEPLARWCRRQYLSPNHLTALSLVLGMMAPIVLTLHSPWLAVVLLWLSGLADVLDGTLARQLGQSSDWGAVLDNVCDRLVEFSVILGLMMVAPTERALLCFLMGMSVAVCVTSFLLVGLFTQNYSQKSFHYSPGLIERAEAFGFWTLMFLFPAWFSSLSILFVILTFWTALYRLYRFYQTCHAT
jgi:phosphatidylglycerophosphate synthase